MHKVKKYILITFGFILVTLLFIRTSLLKSQIELIINSKISTYGWNYKAEKYEGHPFSTSRIKNISLKHLDGSTAHIDELTINIGLISSLFGIIVFDFLTVEGMKSNLKFENQITNMSIDNNKVLTIPIHIKSFFLETLIETKFSNKDYSIETMIGGELIGGLEPLLDCDLLKISFSENNDNICKLDNLVMGLDQKSYFMRELRGQFLGLPISGDILFDRGDSKLKGTVNVFQFRFPDELFSKLPLKTKFSNFNGNFNFESNLRYFNGELKLKNDFGLNMIGNFDFHRKKEAWIIKSLQLNGEDSQLNVTGIWNKKNRINCQMTLENLDLNRWIENKKNTNVSGLFIIDAGLTKINALDQIDITMEAVESQFFEQGEIAVQGQFSYRDSIISTIDPVTVLIDDSFLELDGLADFKNNIIELYTDMERADIDLINNFLPGNFLQGKATGNLKIKGDLYSPSAEAELMCEDVAINDFQLKSLKLNSLIESKDRKTSGFLDITAGEGSWKGKSFESGTVSALLKNAEVHIENFHFKSGKDFLQSSGYYNGIDHYIIDRIQLAYKGSYLINTKPVEFTFIDSVIKSNPLHFHINDGVLEGNISGGVQSNARFKMSNFDAEILTQFLDDEKLKLSGLIFGEISLGYQNDDFDIDADLSLKKGKYMDESFDEMNLSCLYRDGVLHVDDISMTRKGDMGMQATGVIPLKNKKSTPYPITLESSFTNLSLEFIHRFIPNFYKIKGIATGAINLGGSLDRTIFNYDFSARKSVFDVVELGDFNSTGSYDGKNLKVQYANSISNSGLISSSGILPFDLNLGSSNFGKMFNESEIKYIAKADINSLPFLSPYIDELDSVDGKINIELVLYGNGGRVVREGNISITNASLHTLLFSDPISSVNAVASIRNNIMSIQKVDLMLHNYNSIYTEPLKNNTEITGNIDFSKFFNPRYDLKIKAREASYELLFFDISGKSNLDLSLIGRDTVSLSGTIETQEAKVFYEFSTEEIGTTLKKGGDNVFSYNLNIPIVGTAYFQNSQIDAEVTGELNLSQIGNQEIDFGGQILVEDGGVYSYKDYFDGLNGIVSFDNKGFNPYIEVNASTMIDDEIIYLNMRGGVNDLDIILNSKSDFSESDILELITWGKRIEDQEWTSTGFGNQTVSFLGTLLENQLEKNIKESNLGMMSYVDDISITGAAGLIQGANEDSEVSVKTKLSDKTFLNLSYKRSFSLNEDRTQTSQIGVEYKLNRHFSLVGAYDNEGNLNLKYRYRYAY